MKNTNALLPESSPAIPRHKERTYGIIAGIAILLAIIQLAVSLGLIVFVLPSLVTLYTSLHVTSPYTRVFYSIVFISAIFAISTIFVGIKLLIGSPQTKEKFFLPGIIAIIIYLLFTGISIGSELYTVISPLYSIVGEVPEPHLSSPPVVLSSSPMPTAKVGWETYINKDMKFQISYPATFIVRENVNAKMVVPEKYPEDSMTMELANPLSDSHSYSLVITTFNVPLRTTVYDILNANNIGECDVVDAKQGVGPQAEQTTIDTNPAVIFKDSRCAVSSGTNIYTVSNNKAYWIAIAYTIGRTQYADIQDSVDQILATFKFLQ